MVDLVKIVKMKTMETIQYMNELSRRVKIAESVMDEVYSEREKKLKFKQSELACLLQSGDFDSAMLKLKEANGIMQESPDKEIKMRLADCELKDCKV